MSLKLEGKKFSEFVKETSKASDPSSVKVVGNSSSNLPAGVEMSDFVKNPTETATESELSTGQLLLKSNGTMKTLDGALVAKSADVESIGSRFFALDLYSYEVIGRLKADGTAKGYVDTDRTLLKIPVKAGDEVIFSGLTKKTNSGYSNIVVYDSSGTVTYTRRATSLDYSVESDGFVSVGYEITDNKTIKVIKSAEENSFAYQKAVDAESKASESLKMILSEGAMLFKKKGRLKSDGDLISVTGWATIYKIPCFVGDVVSASGFRNTTSEGFSNFIVQDSSGTIVTSGTGTDFHYTFSSDGFLSACFYDVDGYKENVSLQIIPSVGQVTCIERYVGSVSNVDTVGVNPYDFYTEKFGKEIKNILNGADFSALAFADIHYSAKNIKRLFSVAEQMQEKSEIKAVINVGDTSKTSNTSSLDYYNGFVTSCGVPVLAIAGNHDCWSSASPRTWSSAEVVRQYITDKVISQAEVTAPNSTANYWYKDFGNLRIIGLLCMGVVDDDTGSITENQYFDSVQSQWFSSILEDARTSGKKVIVMNHAPFVKLETVHVPSTWNSWKRHEVYSDRLRTLPSATNIVKSFIDAGGEFICWMGGHTHCDNVTTLESDSRQMMVNFATAKYNYHDDGCCASSEDEYGYDCMTMIGVDLTNGLIKFLRLGYDMDSSMQKREPFAYDFINRRFL